MIRAIVFDFFGVLASDGWLPFKNKYFGDSRELFEKAGELNKASNLRQIKYHDFMTEIIQMAGVDESEFRSFIDNQIVDEKLLEYIEELKKKYKIGIFSNAAGPLDRFLGKEQLELFDAIALSYESGVVKPNPQAFQIIADRLGVKPQECIFIDDQERYRVGAEMVGMKFIVYKDFPQLKREMEQLLSASSNHQPTT